MLESIIAIDIWRTHQLVCLLGLNILFCMFISVRLGWTYAIAIFYTVMSGIYVYQSQNPIWGPIQSKIDSTTAQTIIPLIFISSVVAMSPKEWIKGILDVIMWIMILNCFILVYAGYGIFNASSMDSAMTALMTPYLFWRTSHMHTNSIHFKYFYLSQPHLLLRIIPIVAITMTQGSTAYFILAAACMTFVIHRKKYVYAIAALAVCVAAGAYTQGQAFLSTSQRWDHWKMFMEWWARDTWHLGGGIFNIPDWDVKAHHWIGTGTGTFNWLGPSIQNKITELFIYMHNEYLQTIFEQGYIGLILFLAVAVEFAIRGRKNPMLLTTLAALSVACLTQFPFRYLLTEIFVVCLIRVSQKV